MVIVHFSFVDMCEFAEQENVARSHFSPTAVWYDRHGSDCGGRGSQLIFVSVVAIVVVVVVVVISAGRYIKYLVVPFTQSLRKPMSYACHATDKDYHPPVTRRQAKQVRKYVETEPQTLSMISSDAAALVPVVHYRLQVCDPSCASRNNSNTTFRKCCVRARANSGQPRLHTHARAPPAHTHTCTYTQTQHARTRGKICA